MHEHARRQEARLAHHDVCRARHAQDQPDHARRGAVAHLRPPQVGGCHEVRCLRAGEGHDRHRGRNRRDAARMRCQHRRHQPDAARRHDHAREGHLLDDHDRHAEHRRGRFQHRAGAPRRRRRTHRRADHPPARGRLPVHVQDLSVTPHVGTAR